MPPSRTGQRNVSRDRGRVAAGQGYEPDYFARKHGISREQARSSFNGSEMTERNLTPRQCG